MVLVIYLYNMLRHFIKTSEIEGEIINRIDVMSSIRKNLGLAISKEPKHKNAIGLSQMLIDVRKTYKPGPYRK